MAECRSCGAHLFDGATFCARCLTPITPSDAEVQQGLVDVAAAGGRWVDRSATTASWNADPRHVAPLPAKEHSRWKASPQSFSGPVKVLMTVIVGVGVPYLFFAVANGLAIGPMAVWSIIVTPRVVRDLWRRTRVR